LFSDIYIPHLLSNKQASAAEAGTNAGNSISALPDSLSLAYFPAVILAN
jgi:hypothetical protein